MKKHWTPRYIVNRSIQAIESKLHPDHPWLTSTAIRWLEEHLSPEFSGVEWGSGRSTSWLAARVKHLTSVEANNEYYDWVKKTLAEKGISNVSYFLAPVPPGTPESPVDPDPAQVQDYVFSHTSFEKDSINFALVDGNFRVQCISRAFEWLMPGGFLILDNSERFIPSDSPAPNSIRDRKKPGWEPLLAELAKWEKVQTSNGVWDTTIWVKPRN